MPFILSDAIQYIAMILFLIVHNFIHATTTSGELTQNQLSSAGNEFGFNVYNRVSTLYGNHIISPISLSIAFGMLHLGANGLTANELRRVLRYEKHEISDESAHLGFSQLLAVINQSRTEYQLSIANRIIAQNKFKILENYTNALLDSYGADMQSVDFATDGQNTINAINEWVASKTNDKIKSLFDKPLPTNTMLVIVNAVYFKGKWLREFSPSVTHESEFFNGGQTSVKVQMMIDRGQHWNYTDSDALRSQILELPYAGHDLSMIVILPRDRNGLRQLKSVINEDKLSEALSALKDVRLDVFLPKFKVEKSYELKWPLRSLGLTYAFSDLADLSGINGKRDLKVSRVVHKVVIEVNEEGSEAAAVTGVVAVSRSGFFNRATLFNADHPFLFVIRDKRTDVNLFMGQLARL